MNKLFKIIIFIFAGLLSVGSFSLVDRDELIVFFSPDTGKETPSAFLEAGSLKGFCLHQPFENLVSPVTYFPAPDSRFHASGAGIILAIELKISSFVAGYLSRAKDAHFGLSVSDIIFPHHYFW